MKKRFLVTSILMLLLTVFALSTSTYAWFSMNEKVEAKNMTVTAKTDATYLVISDTSTLGSETVLDLASVTGTLLPVSYTTTAIKNAANTEELVAANKWYKAVGTSNTVGTAKADTQTQLNITENSNKGSVSDKDYYLVNSFYIGLAEGSDAVETGKGIQADVTFNATKSSNLNKCLTVKIVYGDTDDPSAEVTTQTFVYGAATGEEVKHSTALQADGLITTTATKVTVYIYFDGANEHCTTQNAVNLDSISVNIAFFVNETLHA